MNEQVALTALVRRSIRLERRQWDRMDRLAARAGLTRADTYRQVVELGSNDFERAVNNNGGQPA